MANYVHRINAMHIFTAKDHARRPSGPCYAAPAPRSLWHKRAKHKQTPYCFRKDTIVSPGPSQIIDSRVLGVFTCHYLNFARAASLRAISSGVRTSGFRSSGGLGLAGKKIGFVGMEDVV